MRYKRAFVATLKDVTITRGSDGETATIAYKDPGIYETDLKIGSDIKLMSDQEILDCHNECLMAQEASIEDYVAVEVPLGKPQVTYYERSGQWVPRGEVLRCHVSDDENGKAIIWLDDREFNMEEFGRVLSAFAGWGMRITFVPGSETHQIPLIEIKDLPPDE